MIAQTPQPPYWAVIFASHRTDGDQGYAQMADAMDALARQQPGYLGIEHARDANSKKTNTNRHSEEDIRAWKANVDHLGAQRLGKEKWYAGYQVRVCRVERAYGFER